MKNYYEILGILPSASDEAIKSAYRKLAVKLHPDKNEGDAFYDDFFKNVNEAYSILGNRESRAKYDAVLLQKQKENSNNYNKTTEKPTPNTQQTYTKNNYSVWDSVDEAKKNRNIAVWINLIVLTILIITLYTPKSWSTKYSEQGNVVVNEGRATAVNGLNMRREPYQWSQKIATIPFNSIIEVIEINDRQETINGVTANWMKVKYLDNVGWVWGGFIDTEDSVVNTINIPEIEETEGSRTKYYYDADKIEKENSYIDSDNLSNGKSSVPKTNNPTPNNNEAKNIDTKPEKRKIVKLPNFGDLEIIEECTIEYRIEVTETGKVLSANFVRYNVDAPKDNYSKKEMRVREKMLSTIKRRIEKDMLYEQGGQSNERYVVQL